MPDVRALAAAYETETFWRGIRQRRDGLVNAFGRDLNNIIEFTDRHFFNYSKDDPYVNFPTNATHWDKLFDTYVSAWQWVPTITPWSNTNTGF